MASLPSVFDERCGQETDGAQRLQQGDEQSGPNFFAVSEGADQCQQGGKKAIDDGDDLYGNQESFHTSSVDPPKKGGQGMSR